MNHLEDVLTPSLLNALYVDVVTVGVVTGNVCVTNFDLTRIIEADKIDHNIGEFGPLLKFPFHLELSILVNLFINRLN